MHDEEEFNLALNQQGIYLLLLLQCLPAQNSKASIGAGKESSRKSLVVLAQEVKEYPNKENGETPPFSPNSSIMKAT